MAGQHTAVNTFPGLVHTARHTMRVCNTRSQQPNRKEGAAEGRADNWGEVVTRQPYRKVRLDHLLSKENVRCQITDVSYSKSTSGLPDELLQSVSPIFCIYSIFKTRVGFLKNRPGAQLSWESACPASRRSRVRFPLSPPSRIKILHRRRIKYDYEAAQRLPLMIYLSIVP